METETPPSYQWIPEMEQLEQYEPGGYHPIMISDVLDRRYLIVEKLGYGGYSTVWLARDLILDQYVAIKVGISGQPNTRREVGILQELNALSSRTANATEEVKQHDLVPAVLDEFDLCGPNGTHTCYAMTPAEGNLTKKLTNPLFPVDVARALTAKLAIAVRFLHSNGFVHADLRLQNILIKLPSSIGQLSVQQFREKYGDPETVPVVRKDHKPITRNVPQEAVVPLEFSTEAGNFTLSKVHDLMIGDFGEAFTPATEKRLGKQCNIPLPSMAPEALFEPDQPISYPSDIWSLAIAMWDIMGMKPMFSNWSSLDEIVADQIDVIGHDRLPKNWEELWERKEEETDDEHAPPRRPSGTRERRSVLDEAFQKNAQDWRRKIKSKGVFEEGGETKAIVDMFRGMLKFDPKKRSTIEQVLASEWMVKWALPELEGASEARS